MEIAAGTGSADLAARAQEAFTTALVDVGAIGGVILLLVAAAVAALTPRTIPWTASTRKLPSGT